jgi:hypothetical protein
VRGGNYQQRGRIKKEVRQGCTLSLTLFNLYVQKRLEEVTERLDEANGGVNVHGVRAYFLRFADDVAVLV